MDITISQQREYELYEMLSRLDLGQFKNAGRGKKRYDQKMYQEAVAKVLELYFNQLQRCIYGHILEPDCHENAGYHTATREK